MFSFIDKYIVLAINLVMTAVVSRLLAPSEVGVFMVAAGLVMMTEAFRDFGVSVYLIQERDLTKEGVRTAFTVGLILSAGFAGILYVLSSYMASFYEERGLELILRLAAIGFLVTPFCNPALALFRREMDFGKLAVISVSGALVNFTAVVILAASGLGYMSLAWASLISGVIGAAIVILYRPQFWIFRPSLAEWRKVVGFGGYSSAMAMLNTLHAQLPQLMLGRVLGFDAVGLYSRAMMMCQISDRLIFNAVQPVILPSLAARVRAGGDLKDTYLGALTQITAVQWPFLVCVVFFADPLIQILLGHQWTAVVPLVRIIALASMFLFPAFMTYPLLVSIGRVKDTLTVSLISLPPSMALIFAASFLGLGAVAATMFLAAPLQAYVALTFIRRQVPFRWRELVVATRTSAVVTMCTAATPAAAVALAGFTFETSIPVSVVTGVGAATGWVVGLKVTGNPLLAEMRGANRHVASAVWAFYAARFGGAALP